MSGFGAVQAMIDSQKNNRGLVKKRGLFYNDKPEAGKVGVALEFKKADPVYLAQLKTSLAQEKKQAVRIRVLALIGLFLAAILLVWLFLL